MDTYSKIKQFYDRLDFLKYQATDDLFKNGLIGNINEDDYFVFCNEKEYNGEGFLFKCCKGCKHINL